VPDSLAEHLTTTARVYLLLNQCFIKRIAAEMITCYNAISQFNNIFAILFLSILAGDETWA